MDFIDVKARRYKIPNTQYWGTEGDVFDRLMKPRSTSCLLWYIKEIDVFDGLIKPRSTVLPFRCVSYFENLKGNYRNIERMRAPRNLRRCRVCDAYTRRHHKASDLRSIPIGQKRDRLCVRVTPPTTVVVR